MFCFVTSVSSIYYAFCVSYFLFAFLFKNIFLSDLKNLLSVSAFTSPVSFVSLDPIVCSHHLQVFNYLGLLWEYLLFFSLVLVITLKKTIHTIFYFYVMFCSTFWVFPSLLKLCPILFSLWIFVSQAFWGCSPEIFSFVITASYLNDSSTGQKL